DLVATLGAACGPGADELDLPEKPLQRPLGIEREHGSHERRIPGSLGRAYRPAPDGRGDARHRLEIEGLWGRGGRARACSPRAGVGALCRWKGIARIALGAPRLRLHCALVAPFFADIRHTTVQVCALVAPSLRPSCALVAPCWLASWVVGGGRAGPALPPVVELVRVAPLRLVGDQQARPLAVA